MTRAPMAAGATRFVAIVMVLSALLSAPSRLGAQVLRNPETPYHFLRYDDVPSDQNSPYWPKTSGRRSNSSRSTSRREAILTSVARTASASSTSATCFSASRRARILRLMTCIAFCSKAISISAILSGHSYNSAIIWQPRRARPRPLMSIVWTCSRGLPTCGLRSGRTGASLSGEGVRRCSSGRPGWSTFAKGRTSV